MAQTSIHIEPIKLSADVHNRRLKALDYVRKDLTPKNEHWEANGYQGVAVELANIKASYKRAKGKAMHKRATPIREGVAVIDDTTTMADLRQFCQLCQDRWGIKPLSITTHKDEGHTDEEGKWRPNLHAHIIWRWCDEDGVTCKLGRGDMAEMQTLLAQSLSMERGQSSDVKHLNAVQYKVEQEEERLSQTIGERAQAEKAIAGAQEAREEIARLDYQIDKAQEKLGDIDDLKKALAEVREKADRSVDEIIADNTTSRMGGLMSDKIDYPAVIDEMRKVMRATAMDKQAVVMREKHNKDISDLLYNEQQTKLLEAEEEKKKMAEEMQEISRQVGELLGDLYRRFVQQVDRYKHMAFTLLEKLYMWGGTKYKDNRNNTYAADRTRGEFLVNGKGEEQRIAEAQRLAQSEEQTRSRGMRR